VDLGHVDDDDLMTAAYSAADVMVLPTRADNLPCGVMECMACGTPCVSFRVGGVPEMVRPGRTGWLAEPGDAGDLASKLHEALSAPGERLAAMRSACREMAVREWDVVLMTRRYVAVYEELLAARKRPARVGEV
jgi:glycosyltransferase involved in cell wall biosynthesis